MSRRRSYYSETQNEPASTGLEETVPETAHGIICNAPAVNMRLLPSGGSEVIKCLDQTTRVEILDRTDTYWRIKTTEGLIGYVHSYFCKEASV